ncbi:MAG: type II toxin-antitoxin system Phd/YefM family antitoxin [Gallionellaceae bacterium]|jgi:antitoxin (DNA-binding transcriptional repressor) of toxin-antitoxin stability system|nr:type II toxin-antitoxin system Phd/YefM family antitoxin [Gallionellaceae bacterium]
MQHTVHAAKTNLSRLIEDALAGEEVIIAKGKKPMVKIVPITSRPFVVGLLKDKLAGEVPDFLAPMPEDEWAAWGSAE